MRNIPKSVWVWVVFGVVSLGLTMGNDGFWDMLRYRREKKKLERTLVELQAEHERLRRENKRIEEDPSYTEFLIRKYLGYGYRNEIEYHVPRKTNGRERA